MIRSGCVRGCATGDAFSFLHTAVFINEIFSYLHLIHMDGWVDGRMGERTDKRTDGRTDGRTGEWLGALVGGDWISEWIRVEE